MDRDKGFQLSSSKQRIIMSKYGIQNLKPLWTLIHAQKFSALGKLKVLSQLWN